MIKFLSNLFRPKPTAAAHTGASSKRSLRDFNPKKRSPDQEILPELDKLVARSRDLFRNNPIAGGAVRNQVTNVIGSGLKLQPRIDRKFLGLTDEQADEWEANTEREFLVWAESQNCDAARKHDFYELQELAFQTFLISGECFAFLPLKKDNNFPYDLKVQLIEGDRIDSPFSVESTNKKVQSGIEIDDWGAPVAYWVLTSYPGDYTTPPEYKRVLARGSSGRQNAIHLMKSDRPGQRRGVPFLTPVIDILKNLTRYSESVLTRAIVQSYLTVFIKSENPELPDSPFLESQKVLTETEETVNYELGPGAIMPLLPGESIETVNPGGSDPNSDEFWTWNLKLVGMALEIPFEILTHHFQASYSAARGAFLQFHKKIKAWRTWDSRKFCQPIYEEWLTEAILKNRIIAPGYFDDIAIRKAWARAQWNGPAPGQIDPTKEVNSYILQRNEGFITNQDAAAQINGSDWESNMAMLKTEQKLKQEVFNEAPQN